MSEPRFTKAGQHFGFFNTEDSKKKKGKSVQQAIYDYCDEHDLEIQSLQPYTFANNNGVWICGLFTRRNMLKCAMCNEPSGDHYLCEDCQ